MSRLAPFERRWAENLFEALLGPVEDEGLPAFASIDRDEFWNAIETAPGPSFAPGLRAIIYGLNLLPITRFRRPFHALDEAQRAQFLESLDSSPGYAVRQMVMSMKMLACFAYFDAPRVRARFKTELSP